MNTKRRLRLPGNRLVVVPIALILLLAGWGVVHAAHTITLSVSGGPDPGAWTVYATLTADGSVNNTNLYIELQEPGGPATESSRTTGISLGETESTTISWTPAAGSYPAEGNYTFWACWSPGNTSTNCLHAGPVTLTFFSVPTLEGVFLIAAGGLLVAWFVYVGRRVLRPGKDER